MEKFYGEKYIECVDAEWCQDNYLDFAIVVKTDILLDPKFGFNIKEIKNEDYNKTDLGTFWCANNCTWIWAIASSYPITENTRRTQIGSFNLWDSETGNIFPNTKIWREFKKGITPRLNSIMKEELKKC